MKPSITIILIVAQNGVQLLRTKRWCSPTWVWMKIPRQCVELKRSSTFHITGHSTLQKLSSPTGPWRWNRKVCKRQEAGKGNCMALEVSFPYGVYIARMLTVSCFATREEPRRRTKRSNNGESRKAERARVAAILSCLVLQPKLANLFLGVPYTNIPVLRTSTFQRSTIKQIVTFYFLYCSPLNFLPRASSKIILKYFQHFFRWKAWKRNVIFISSLAFTVIL